MRYDGLQADQGGSKQLELLETADGIALHHSVPVVLDDAAAGKARLSHGRHVLGWDLKLRAERGDQSTQALAETTMDLSL